MRAGAVPVSGHPRVPVALEGSGQDHVRLWKWGLRLAAIGLVCTYSWVDRFFMGVDGISYLDSGYAYMRGDWRMAVNPYWGAGYSWLLGAFLTLFRVPPYWESTGVHLTNILIFVATLIAFEYFLSGVIQLRKQVPCSEVGRIPLNEWTWWVLGYLLFIAINLFIVAVTNVTPDVCVEAIMLLASGLVVRMAAGRDGVLAYAALGVTLGVGFLIKSPMFPMGLVYLGMAWLASRRFRSAHWRAAMALGIFLLICAPYILAISRAAGHLTIGENGRITYGSVVMGINDFSYWQGQFPGAGTPRHPEATRKLMSDPEVYEFAPGRGGTLPPYYSPAYWADGLKFHMNWRGQFSELRLSGQKLLDVFYYLREFVLVLLVLLFLQDNTWAFLRRMFLCWPIWLPALVALAMYAPILIEPRYIGGYVLLFWAAVSFSLEFPDSVLTRQLFRATAFALVILVGYRFLHEPTAQLRQSAPPVNLQWTVAQSLMQHGIRPGDRVAQMLFHNRDVHYWAHLAGVSIVAEVPFEEEGKFWASSPEVQKRVEALLQQTGAKVLVTQNPPPLPPSSGWERIPGTDYAFLSLAPR